MNSDRRGFTLTELIIVAVLGSLLIMVTLQVLITNQRTYTAQNAQIQGQQTIRAAADVLFSELREISARGGDIISMSSGSITVRSMRNFGVACAVAPATPTVTVLRVGNWFAVGDSVFVFADKRENISTDDVWIRARVTAVDTTVACGASRGVRLTFTGQAGLFAADSVRVGAPVRSYLRYTYGLITESGQTYLGRTPAGGTAAPMVGPLKPSTGIQFTYLDSLGSVTSVTTNVRQITVRVRTVSEVLNSLGQPVSDSLTIRIYTRN
ncbi:MAG TPA: prepilin-type N-terminal cleavage/methylation domain-containing protein [Longimicrobiales bacterium]|nr:prepilin-type N-terminal cleavage/methylation domain-containing protein [Longimicrobiales bacterium]